VLEREVPDGEAWYAAVCAETLEQVAFGIR